MEYRPQRAPDTPSNAASMSTFKRRKRPFSRSPTILGRIVRLLGILTVLSAGFDLFLFFRHTNRLAIPSWIFIVCGIVTFLFCIVGYFGTTLYDGTLITCFILFLVTKIFLGIWEIGLVFIYNMTILDQALAIVSLIASFITLAATSWFAVILRAYGPPPAEDMAFSAFVI